MAFGYHRLYIGGQLVDAADGARREVICPGTGKPVAEVAWASPAEARKALKAAAAGFAAWSALSLVDRKEWMHKLRDAVRRKEELLRDCIMHEMGKTWEGTAEDVDTVVNSLTFYPEEMTCLKDEELTDAEGKFAHRVTYEPVGVAVAILAWNFPLLNLGFKIGPALAAGCSLILKPSPRAPLSAYVIGEICAEIGLPAGVVNVLCGPDETIGPALSKSPIPGLLTLIGSTQTGRKLMRQGSKTIKRYSMELGGNAPVLIFPDADVAQAADMVGTLKFANAGQICVTPNRVFVHRDVMEEFARLIVAKAGAVKMGFGRDSGTTMGPLISEEARRRVDALVQDAVGAGAEILAGGKLSEAPPEGYFYPPTVLTGVTPRMRIFKEEIFGPVVSLIEFTNERRVLRSANDTEMGLASFLFTKDAGRIDRLSRALRFGEVQVNGFKYGIDLPHIGIRQSGIGCDCSHLALHDYLTRKRITEKK